jgi:hypothetical protein
MKNKFANSRHTAKRHKAVSRGRSNSHAIVNKKNTNMNSECLASIKSVYGNVAAAQVRQDLKRGPLRGQSQVGLIAKAVARQRKMHYHTLEPFTSVPVPMDFDPNSRRDP